MNRRRMPFLESRYYQIDDHAIEPPSRAPASHTEDFKVGDQIKDGPSELALPRSLTPSVRLSALWPCLKERKNGRGGRGIDRSRMERGAFSGNVTATTTP